MVNTGPNDKLDFAHIAKLALWTLDNAIAYSLGEDPSVVNFAEIQPLERSRLKSDRPRPSELKREYLKRAELVEGNADYLAERLKGVTAFSGGSWCQRKTSPAKFVLWALENFDSVPFDRVPKELVAALEARGFVITKKPDVAGLDAIGAEVVEQEQGSGPEKPPTERERLPIVDIQQPSLMPVPAKPKRTNRDALSTEIDLIIGEQKGDDALYSVFAGLTRRVGQPGSCVKDVDVKKGVVFWERPGVGAATISKHALTIRLQRRKRRLAR